jgi:hypothetical protein
MIRGEQRLSPGTCPDKFVEKKRPLVYSQYTQKEAKDGIPAGNHGKGPSNR